MGNSLTVLHAGCGFAELPYYLAGHKEVRLDIDESVKPDIVASLIDLGDIGQFDIVFCSHALEHLFSFEVDKAVREFHRVLKDGGVLVCWVPDLTDVQCNDEILFVSPGGPISGKDLYYGHREYVKTNPFMAHKTGFTQETFKKALSIFKDVKINTDGSYSIMGTGVK